MSVAPKINESQKPIIDQNYCVDHGLLLRRKLFINHSDIHGVMTLG